jgi:hypothetical protein
VAKHRRQELCLDKLDSCRLRTTARLDNILAHQNAENGDAQDRVVDLVRGDDLEPIFRFLCVDVAQTADRDRQHDFLVRVPAQAVVRVDVVQIPRLREVQAPALCAVVHQDVQIAASDYAVVRDLEAEVRRVAVQVTLLLHEEALVLVQEVVRYVVVVQEQQRAVVLARYVVVQEQRVEQEQHAEVRRVVLVGVVVAQKQPLIASTRTVTEREETFSC